jgi:hypothetical protein
MFGIAARFEKRRWIPLVELQCCSLDQWFCRAGMRSAVMGRAVSSVSFLKLRARRSPMSRASRNRLVFQDCRSELLLGRGWVVRGLALLW